MSTIKILRLFLSTVAFILLMITYTAADEEYSAPSTRVKRDTPIISKKLRIVTIRALPYVNITQGDNGLKFEGFIPDLIFALSEKLGFAYEFYESPDGRYGSLNDDGSWTGMMGEIIKNKYDQSGQPSDDNNLDQPGADIVAAPLTMTSKRQEYVDFIHPFHNLGLILVAKKASLVDNGTDTWPFDFSILKPLSGAVWGLIILITVVVGLLLFALNHFNPYEWGGRYNIGLASIHHRDSFNISGALWFVFSTLHWQGFERAPRSIAAKILTCFWFIFVTLTLVTYIGGLVNHLWWASMVLRHNPIAHPIRDLEDLVAGSGRSFKYGTVKGGSTYAYVTKVMAPQQVEFQAMKLYWESDDGQQQLVSTMAEGIKKAREEDYAFIMETMSAKWEMNQQPCDLTTIGEQFATRSYGLAVPKNWPYLDSFHQGIMEFNEQGIIDNLEKKWWEGKGECWQDKHLDKVMDQAAAMYVNKSKPKVVNLNMFWGQLVIMVVGVVITLIAAAAEIFYYRYKGRYLTSNHPQDQSLKLENEDGNI